MENAADSFFTRHCKLIPLPAGGRQASLPFKDHAQFAVITDILCRKNQHHAALLADYFNKLAPAFLEAFALFLNSEQAPLAIRGAQLIYFNIDDIVINKNEQLTLDRDFTLLTQTLSTSEKPCIFIVPALSWLTKSAKHTDNMILQKHIKSLESHPKCRFLALTNPKDFRLHQLQDSDLELIRINKLNDNEIMAILMAERKALENYHQVAIPEETLSHAYSLVKRYLSTHDTLNKTILVLDSAAARLSNPQHSDEHHELKPVLTTSAILSVISAQTRIPAARLLPNNIKWNEFNQLFQHSLQGQDAAAALFINTLSQAFNTTNQRSGTLGAFLLAGPKHTGKTTAITTLAQQIFQQTNMLYFAHSLPPEGLSLADLKLKPHLDHQCLSFREVAQQTPHAIIVFENIESAPQAVIDGLGEALSSGFLQDVGGQYHDLRECLFFFTTTLGSERLNEIASHIVPQDDSHHTDLMQLILSEKQQDTLAVKPHYSPQALASEITPILSRHLSNALCQHTCIIPFLPLSKAAIEKIIRLRLNTLGKQLHAKYGIDLGYAPEVIRHIVNEALAIQAANHQVINIETIFTPVQLLVDQKIAALSDTRSKPTQLFIQLNETGQLLQCEWESITPIRHQASQ